MAGLAVMLLFELPTAQGAAAPEADVKSAMVKVYAASRAPDYDAPWSPGFTEGGVGSGFLIGEGRVLTNAHVVSNAVYVEVRLSGSAERVQARVEYISHAADLALLAVEDEGFASGVSPLELGGLPRAGEEVIAYGFPTGGDSLSVTRGIVSRVEHQEYVHSGRTLLAVQVDAAVNPGNSGGPALIEGRVAGVAMQGIGNADNISYLVPVTRIAHFLKDVADGELEGIPHLGIRIQSADNPDMRQRYRVPEGRGGVRVRAVYPGTTAHGLLEVGDVLLSVGAHEVAPDGTTTFRAGERTSFVHLLQLQQAGTQIDLQVLRAGEVLDLHAMLRTDASMGRLVPEREFTLRPRYYIYGGLVFQPLTLNYLETWGSEWPTDAPAELTRLVDRPAARPGEEVIILQTVLAAAVNTGYQDAADLIVETVDGRRPLNLAELVALIEGDGEGFAILGCERGIEIALDRRGVAAAHAEVLARYGIDADRWLGSQDEEAPAQPRR
jgi:S1-C subfamily serine protease